VKLVLLNKLADHFMQGLLDVLNLNKLVDYAESILFNANIRVSQQSEYKVIEGSVLWVESNSNLPIFQSLEELYSPLLDDFLGVTHPRDDQVFTAGV